MYDIALPKVESVVGTDNYGVFHIEPLEPGFGTTLGNALRRVLLSSLPGAAIDSVKIDGVYHEFSAIPGVKEDAMEVILNIKQIRLRSTADRPEVLRLEAHGPGRVTAADIKCPPEVEIVNPEQHLLDIDSSEDQVTMEMTVQRGKGYSSADGREGLGIGVLPVDAIFTPIRKANYVVQPVRIGVANYERLVLEVCTDGTISPKEAVAQSAQILVRHLSLVTEVAARLPAYGDKYAFTPTPVPPAVYDKPIEELELSVRSYNCLKRAGITKIGQVLEMSEDELLAVRNFGRKSLDELRERLDVHGYLAISRLIGAPRVEEGVEEEREEAPTPAVAAEEKIEAAPPLEVGVAPAEREFLAVPGGGPTAAVEIEEEEAAELAEAEAEEEALAPVERGATEEEVEGRLPKKKKGPRRPREEVRDEELEEIEERYRLRLR